MPAFSTKRRVAFTAAQMMAIVADVEHYPEFVPLCTALVVKSRRATADGDELIARMSVGYKAFAESFTTRVAVNQAAKRIDVTYVDGPFRKLHNVWRFADVAGGSDVHFDIDYEFRSPLLGAVVGSVFDQAFRKFADAFEARARDVYGTAAAGA
jgi:coenzyme Q-binding protein COQ10